MALYKCGDVVWVLASKRLGWWPARVENVDKLTPDLKRDVTDDIICVAKYLNEDNYQFVEDSNQICKYSSDRKEEHISAGMRKYFEKKKVNETSSPFMKFPTDVKQAEYLTGGSPDIVDHERFQPKKTTPAQSTYKSIFVDPRSKEVTKAKLTTKSTASSRGAASNDIMASPVANKVSHPRFKGISDHEVRIRTQDNSPLLSSSTTSSLSSISSGQSSANYVCDLCAFSTARLNLMVMHKKTHLNVGTASALSPNVCAAQKRPTSSPTKKTPSKRAKKTLATQVKEESVPNTQLTSGDLFDQVKRNLEAKESGHESQIPPVNEKTSCKTPGRKRVPRSPKSPRALASAKATSKNPKSPAVTGNKSYEGTSCSTTKALLNPKKKWLKSSMQSQSEVNPEVKIKLMADWDEEEEQQQQQQQQQSSRTETSATADEGVIPSSSLTAKHESDFEQERLKESAVIQQRSGDEKPMDTMENRTTHQADENGVESKADEEESMAGISAEIDKLNADLNDSNRCTIESSDVVIPTAPKLNGVHGCHISLKSNPTVDIHVQEPMKSEEEIKLDVASLLAETSVPVLPDVEGLGKVAVAVVSDTTTMEVETTEIESGNGDVTEGGNILMQVEGGETYMVVWEPGSEANIQELLAEGVVGDGTGTQTLLIDPSSLQAGSDLENLFQMAVAAVAPASTPAPMPSNEQSDPT